MQGESVCIFSHGITGIFDEIMASIRGIDENCFFILTLRWWKVVHNVWYRG